MIQQYKVTDTLYLAEYLLPQSRFAPPPAPPNTNHFLILDVSYSMKDDLPAMRQHLKAKLPTLLTPGDTVSIIWFSGRGQCGALVKGARIAQITDIEQINKAIDKWLHPVGMTGFKEPLELVAQVKREVVIQTQNTVCNLFFLSDGHDNQWRREEVLATAQKLDFSSATVVEYGYYADRTMLASLAQQMGGVHIFSDGFANYEPVIEHSLTQKPAGSWTQARLPVDPIDRMVFTIQGNELRSYQADDEDKVKVPEGTEIFYFLSNASVPGALPSSPTISEHPAFYAVMALYATRMQPDIIWSILKKTGDVALIDEYAECFGKERYTAFQAHCQAAIFDPDARLIKGFDQTRVPADDAFTVLELLELLNDEDRVLLKHPAFTYNRISRKRENASAKLTADELAELQAVADVSSLEEAVARIKASKPVSVKFEDTLIPDGYRIDDLVFSKDRANVSLRFKIPGFIDLRQVAPPELKTDLPEMIAVHRYQTLTAIRDGLYNIKTLPVHLSDETQAKIAKLTFTVKCLPDAAVESMANDIYLLHLDKLPVINRSMVKSVSAEELFRLELALVNAKARQKVFNAFIKDLLPAKVSKGWVERYGQQAAEWLDAQGIKESGYSPKTTQTDAKDIYLAKELKITLKGLMSLSSVKIEDVRAQYEKSKLTPLGALMMPAIQEYDLFMASPVYHKADDKDGVLEAWLKDKAKEATSEARNLSSQITQMKYAVIVGGVWFKEFTSLDEGSMTLNIAGRPILCTVEQKPVEVEI